MIGHAALLLGIASAVLQDSDVHRELHPDGSLHVEYGTARDSAGRTIRDGKYRRLTPDGVELAAGRYRKGQARGKWTFRHPNGEILARGYFDDGVASREWSFRRADGEPWAEGVCAGGHRTGEWTFFDAEGEVDSVRSGVYEHAVARWPDGSVKHRGTLLDGLPFGPWEGWWSDGTPREKGFFVRSKRVGPWSFRHRDGVAVDGLLGSVSPPMEWPAIPSPDGEAADDFEPAVAATLPPLVDEVSPELAGIVAGLKLMNKWQRDEAIDQAVSLAPESVPVLIDALAAIDLGDPKQAMDALRIHAGLVAACGGRGFGWTPRADATPAAENRERVRLWHSLWSATGDDPVVWRIRLGLPPAAGDKTIDFDDLTRWVAPIARGETPWDAEADQAVVSGVEAALAWLAAHQSQSGAWSPDGFPSRCGSIGAGKCDGRGFGAHKVGVTSLALLALVKAGNTLEQGRYRDAVANGVGWLVSRQQPNGIYGQRSTLDHIYNHACATWVVCEVLTRTSLARAPELTLSAKRAVDVILKARNRDDASGWRYEFKPNGESDVSVTGWMIHALHAAGRAGLPVETEALASGLDLVERFTDEVGRVGYSSRGSLSARTPLNTKEFPYDDAGEAMTAVGVLIRLAVGEALGQEPDRDALVLHDKLLARSPPYWEPRSRRDAYYWLWGSRAAHMLDGKAWEAWREALKTQILYNQGGAGDAEGSWSPSGAWGYVGGRVYSTSILAMCLLELVLA